MRVALLTVLLASIAAIASDKFVVLDPTHGPATLKQCSRWAPTASSFFRPNQSEIDALEANLESISELTSQHCCNASKIAEPSNYSRQYLGFVNNGKRYVYVNAYLDQYGLFTSRKEPALVCDGGNAFWGVSFDTGESVAQLSDADFFA